MFAIIGNHQKDQKEQSGKIESVQLAIFAYLHIVGLMNMTKTTRQ